jgi:hypothetical protein
MGSASSLPCHRSPPLDYILNNLNPVTPSHHLSIKSVLILSARIHLGLRCGLFIAKKMHPMHFSDVFCRSHPASFNQSKIIRYIRNAHKILVGKTEETTRKNLGVDGRTVLESILGKYRAKVWTGCIWLRVGNSRVWNFGFHKSGIFLSRWVTVSFSRRALLHLVVS